MSAGGGAATGSGKAASARLKLQGNTATAGASGDLGDIFATTKEFFVVTRKVFCYDWTTMGATGDAYVAGEAVNGGAPCCQWGLEGAASRGERKRGRTAKARRAFLRGI